MGYLELTAVYPPAHRKKIAKSPTNGGTWSETCELAKGGRLDSVAILAWQPAVTATYIQWGLSTVALYLT